MKRIANNEISKSKKYKPNDVRADVEILCDKIDNSASDFVDVGKN